MNKNLIQYESSNITSLQLSSSVNVCHILSYMLHDSLAWNKSQNFD
jgi:hypothetical protein